MIVYTKPHDTNFSSDVITNIENIVGYKFPKEYIQLILASNGGSCMSDEVYNCFDYVENEWSGLTKTHLYEILRIWDCKCEKADNGHKFYFNCLQCEMPSELWPFASASNFDMITFDMAVMPHPVYMYKSGITPGFKDIKISSSLQEFIDSVHQMHPSKYHNE
jgi:hypothetical protein